MTNEQPTAPGGASLTIIALIVFIDTASIGLIIPVVPSLIEGLARVSIDRAAELGGLLLFVFAITQFFAAPIIGGLSDQFGRRPVLLLTLAALGLDYGLMAWAPSLGWLFVGRFIAGIMGASWPAANSCVADTVAPEDRGRMFGMLGAAGGAGFVLGPAIGGLFGQFGDRVPFLIACCLCLAGAAIGLLTLHETLPPEKRRAFTFARANPFGNLIQMAKLPLVLSFLIVIFFMQMAAQAQVAIWAYYGILKFGWTTVQTGLTITLFGTLLAIVQGGLVGKAIARFGDIRTASATLLLGVPTYLTFAFATSSWMMVLGVVIGAMTGFTFPAMQSIMSSRVSDNAQGELQGAIASVISLTSIIGPLLMTNIFGAFADKRGVYFPGAPFLLATGLLIIAIIVQRLAIKRYA
ncbi:MAG: TCR/Tet family MFS transporter [Sphingomonadaceae bacterium]